MSLSKASYQKSPSDRGLVGYLRSLTPPRIILWCYLGWYLGVVVRYFEPSPGLWLNSLGISAIIGTGLVLSTAYAGDRRTALDRWQVFRLYLMPFCVSSFAALIKGRGFVLVFHPSIRDNVSALAPIAVFVLTVLALRTGTRRPGADSAASVSLAEQSGLARAGGPIPSPARPDLESDLRR